MSKINDQAPVKCDKSILIQAGKEKVWRILTGIDQWPDWQTDIKKAKLHGQLKPDTTFDWKSGGVGIHSTLKTVDPYQSIGWTGKSMGLFAIHHWTLIEKGNAVEVKVEESMEGFLAGLFKKMFNKNLEKGMLLWLVLLKSECEKRE